jgi:hypothetical protein
MASLFTKGCEHFRSAGQVAFLAIPKHDGEAFDAGFAGLSTGFPYINAALKLGPRR